MALCGEIAAASYVPAGDERTLLALTNEARAAAGLRPLVWHDGLGQAARAHSTDMAENDCFQHNSCNGKKWSVRVASYYPLWNALGENIALGSSNPRWLHDSWMGSSGHLAQIVGPYSEFGAGIALRQTNFGEWALATEDFGDRGAVPLSSIPTLPAGGVAPRIGLEPARELLVNYFHPGGGAPAAVHAIVGSTCVALGRTAGSATNGTYGIAHTFAGSGCVPVVFEAVRSDGFKYRWPSGKAILVGVGVAGLACADTTTDVPSQTCAEGTPGPEPTPAPPDTTLLGARAALRPSRTSASLGTVSLQATLPSRIEFDPASGPATFRIAVAGQPVWEMAVPSTCGSGPCLVPNPRRTTFRARLASATVTFARTSGSRWKLRLTARDQALAALASGPVELAVLADGEEFMGSATGELRAGRLTVR